MPALIVLIKTGSKNNSLFCYILQDLLGSGGSCDVCQLKALWLSVYAVRCLRWLWLDIYGCLSPSGEQWFINYSSVSLQPLLLVQVKLHINSLGSSHGESSILLKSDEIFSEVWLQKVSFGEDKSSSGDLNYMISRFNCRPKMRDGSVIKVQTFCLGNPGLYHGLGLSLYIPQLLISKMEITIQ